MEFENYWCQECGDNTAEFETEKTAKCLKCKSIYPLFQCVKCTKSYLGEDIFDKDLPFCNFCREDWNRKNP